MIASLHGTLVEKSPTEILVESAGVGYGLQIPLSTYEALGEVGSQVRLLTYLHVREDALQLFGFATREERDMFRLLIAVSGIGPKMAQGILSGITVRELRLAIAQGNLGTLTTISGVGRRIAERLVVELRERIGKVETTPMLPTAATDRQAHVRSEALMALTSLGYSRTTAEKALRAAILETSTSDPTVEVLIKTALRHATRS